MTDHRAQPSPGSRIERREIDADSVRTICRLSVRSVRSVRTHQEQLVASNAVSIAQAHFSAHAWFRAIHADSTPVMFVMLEDRLEKPGSYLWRIMIGACFRDLGFGRRAMGRVIEHVRTRSNATELLTSVSQAPGGPLGFCEALGFELTGEYEDGEARCGFICGLAHPARRCRRRSRAVAAAAVCQLVGRCVAGQEIDTMPGTSMTLSEAISALERYHGRPEPLPAVEPFELILWENVAYLASPARRHEAFELLRGTVGTTPAAILSARPAVLEQATSRGILKQVFATKLRDCARIAMNLHGGDVATAIDGAIDAAKKVLRSFPGIGEPGAEKILLFSGRHAFLAPESNGLRVLVRLGLVQEEKSYARTYAAAREAANGLPAEPRRMQEAHLLLQQHGQTLCRRSKPRCVECPLLSACPHARA